MHSIVCNVLSMPRTNKQTPYKRCKQIETLFSLSQFHAIEKQHAKPMSISVLTNHISLPRSLARSLFLCSRSLFVQPEKQKKPALSQFRWLVAILNGLSKLKSHMYWITWWHRCDLSQNRWAKGEWRPSLSSTESPYVRTYYFNLQVQYIVRSMSSTR